MKNIDLVKYAKRLIIVAFCMPIVIAILFRWPYMDCLNYWLRVQDAGAASDFFSGAVTPILTLAAFLLLLESYNLQKEELELTRKQLENSANELKEQRMIMEEEKNITKKKNELDIFFILFEHWKNNILCIKYKTYFLVNYNYRKQSYETKSNPDKIRGNNYFSYVSVREYGKHLYGLVQIVKPVDNFEIVKALDNNRGEKEYQYVIENLRKNSDPLFHGLNNIMDFISDCSENNKNIMHNTITHSLSWDEKFILNMIADTFILGDIKDNEAERSKLKDNLVKLKLLDS